MIDEGRDVLSGRNINWGKREEMEEVEKEKVEKKKESKEEVEKDRKKEETESSSNNHEIIYRAKIQEKSYAWKK